MSTPHAGKQPFMARFAVPRQAGAALPGRYDERQSLWVVETDCGERPLVAVGEGRQELETKTKVDNEQDDEASHVLGLTSQTQTAVSLEQDDEMLATMLSATITEVTPEADDLQ